MSDCQPPVPVIPRGPVNPGKPVGPRAPVAPICPVAPVEPVAPFDPLHRASSFMWQKQYSNNLVKINTADYFQLAFRKFIGVRLFHDEKVH